jgi:ABC-type glycerol-3-phosphate transport system permease component
MADTTSTGTLEPSRYQRTRAVERQRASTRALRAAGIFFTYLGLCAFGSLALFPLLWILSVSLQQAGGATLGITIPIPPDFRSYPQAMEKLPLLTFLRNSSIITTAATLGALLSSSLVGFSLARLRWPMRDMVFAQVIATMMMPGVVTLVPTFIMFKYLGWLNTFLPLIVPSWTGGAFYVFLMRQFMRGLPPEMDEAARVDGASNLAVFWYVILPLCGPVLAAVAIFSFLNGWNDFLGPSIYLNSIGNYTLALGVYMYQGRYGTQWNLVMAASMFIVVPVLAVFLVAQRYFIRGIQLTGLAGR